MSSPITSLSQTVLIPTELPELPKMAKPKRKLEWSFDMPEHDTASDPKHQQLLRERDRNVEQYAQYTSQELQQVLDYAKWKIRDAHNARDSVGYEYWEEVDGQIREAMKRKK